MPLAKFHQVQEELLLGAATRIVASAYESGERVGVVVESDSIVNALDGMLWSYKKGSFIPHATEFDQYTNEQPVYITKHEKLSNSPTLLVLVDAALTNIKHEKVLIIFSEHSKTINQVRNLYKSLKDKGWEVSFIKGE